MAKSGKKGGGDKVAGTSSGDSEHVIEFTPDGGFNIRNAARNFAELMESSLHPLVIHLPHVSVEFEPGCTPEEIIDGYNMAMRVKYDIKPSNANTETPK